MFGSKLLRGDVDLFQLAYQALRLGQLGQNGVVRFRKFVRRRAGQFHQTFAAAAQFVALLDLVFFAGDEIGGINLGGLMSK